MGEWYLIPCRNDFPVSFVERGSRHARTHPCGREPRRGHPHPRCPECIRRYAALARGRIMRATRPRAARRRGSRPPYRCRRGQHRSSYGGIRLDHLPDFPGHFGSSSRTNPASAAETVPHPQDVRDVDAAVAHAEEDASRFELRASANRSLSPGCAKAVSAVPSKGSSSCPSMQTRPALDKTLAGIAPVHRHDAYVSVEIVRPCRCSGHASEHTVALLDEVFHEPVGNAELRLASGLEHRRRQLGRPEIEIDDKDPLSVARQMPCENGGRGKVFSGRSSGHTGHERNPG